MNDAPVPRAADDDGNRLWILDTPRGRVVQKFYRRRGNACSEGLRHLAARILGRKTGVTAAARRDTERALLARWRAAGVAVPADLTDAWPHIGGRCVAVLECVEGPLLIDRLRRRTRLPREERDPLLRRFAAAWKARHDRALADGDPSLVHEHGSLAHVIVHGERMVTFDLEQGYRPAQPVFPALAKEVAAVLRSLAVRLDEDTFRADLRTLVTAYGDDARLRAVAAWYLRPTGVRRLICAVDRTVARLGTHRKPGKFEVLGLLDEVLAAA